MSRKYFQILSHMMTEGLSILKESSFYNNVFLEIESLSGFSLRFFA